MYENGDRLLLASSHKWPQHYFSKGYFNKAKMERHPRLYKSGYTLLDHSIKNDGPLLIAADARENFNMDHWLAVVKAYGTHVDIYEFTTSTGHKQGNTLYLSNFDSIEKFIKYWMIKATTLINIAEKNKFHISLDNTLFFSDDESGLQTNEKLIKFNSQIKLSGEHIISLPVTFLKDKVFSHLQEI